MEEIIDALAMHDRWTESFDLQNNRLLKSHVLLKIGSGLIESDQRPGEGDLSGKAVIRLAHSSVKEWLLSGSTRLKNFSGNSRFAAPAGHTLIARTRILYLMQFRTEDVNLSAKKDLGALASFAATSWPFHVHNSDYSADILDWTCRFLSNNQMIRNWLLLLGTTERLLPPLGEDQGAALLYATKEGLDPIVKHLVKEHNFNVNGKTHLNMTPLQSAAESDHLSTVEILLSLGAKVEGHSRDSESALLIACDYGSVALIETLLKAGAIANSSYKTSRYTKISPLSQAAQREDDKALRLLIDCHADINGKFGIWERTALHIAASFSRLPNIKTLLACNTDMTVQDDLGYLPLHLALENNGCTPEIAKALYFDGAESIMNEDGDIPLFSAIEGNNNAVCQYIVDISSNL